jgi:SAM-dependent methyltransferase
MTTRRVATIAMIAGSLGFSACASTPAAVPAAATPAAAPPQAAAPAAASATASAQPFAPVVGQAGKDVVWVPTSEALIERMLNLAKLTPADYVIDLGSGDGRNVIAAAKRGARGHGVEFNPDMVALARKLAVEAGVADRATFIQGDMYEADISKATVMALFLLPTNLDKLQDKFLALPPGTRIVMNTFIVTGWEPDASDRLDDTACNSWCSALLYIVPAKVAGRWQLDGAGELTLTQEYQTVTGTLAAAGTQTTVTGRLAGADITLNIGGTTYSGRVDGGRISGSVATPAGGTRAWTATRIVG